MRICKIWDADYPWDIRVEKVATSLAAAGHDVHLVCRNQGRRPTREWTGSFTIHRLPPVPSLLAPAHTFWNLPHPCNPVWISAIAQTVRKIQADLILVRDLPLALPALCVGKIRHLPVVLDMAENYPAMLEDRLRYMPTTAFDRLARSPAIARFVERLALRLADHVIVVIDESRERLMRAGIDPAGISVVCNTPLPDRWKLQGNFPASVNPSECTHVIYLGNLDGSRGIDTAIRAIRELGTRGLLVRLTIVGDGPCLARLQDLAYQLAVTDRVAFTGRLSFSKVQALMARADIGIIPHYATEAWNSTIPNKLFDYMLLGLPVIVSDARPAARIVAAEECGEVFRDRDVGDLVRCLEALGDPRARREKGLRGQAAIQRRYHWSYDARLLIETLERVKDAGAANAWRRSYARALSRSN